MMTNEALMVLLHRALEEAGLQAQGVESDALVAVHPEGEIQLGLASLRRIAAVSDPAMVKVFVTARIDSSLARLQGRRIPPQLDQIRPRLRPPSDDPQAPWSRPLAQGRLALCLVEDAPSEVRYLGPMDIVALEKPMEALVALATRSLIAMAPQGRWSVLTGDVWESVVGDGHDAARALAIGHWLEDARGHLVLMPSRDHLWVVGASVERAIEQILALREGAITQGRAAAYPISGEVFWAQNGGLTHLPVAGRGEAARFLEIPVGLQD